MIQRADRVVVALDAMGGYHGPGVVVPAALGALQQYPELGVTLVGDDAVLGAELARHATAPADRLHIVHASQRVEMDELPSQA